MFTPLTCYDVYVKSLNKPDRDNLPGFLYACRRTPRPGKTFHTCAWNFTGKKTEGSNDHGKKGFCYKPQFGVIVVCSDEKDQETTYNRLKSLGYRLKVVTV